MIVMCGEKKASCVCLLEADHEGPHECECDGAWQPNGAVVRFPFYEGARAERLDRQAFHQEASE